MESSDTILCSNCSRQIPTANYALHENHCKRNISKCPKCQQPVTAQEKEAHDKLHEQVTCECGEVMEQLLFVEHLTNSCLNRDITCTYCELPIRYCEFYCGSRTDFCTLCKQYVTLKNMQMHQQSNCEYPPKRVAPPKSAADRIDLLRQEVLAATQLSSSTHILACSRCSQPCDDLEALQTHLTTQCPLSPHLRFDNDDKIPCEYCNQLVTVASYMEHSTTCGLDSEVDLMDALDYHGGRGGARKKKLERKLQNQLAQKQALKTEIASSKRSMRYQPPPAPISTTDKPARSKNPPRTSTKASAVPTKPSKAEDTSVGSETASNDNTVDLTVSASSTNTAPTDNNTPPAKSTKAPVRLKAAKPSVKITKATRASAKLPKPTSTSTVIDLSASDSVFVALPDTTGITIQGTSVPKQRTMQPKKQPAKRPTARTAA